VSRAPHIIILEPSSILFEGMAAILDQSSIKPFISKANNIDDIPILHQKRKCDLVIINPSLLQNNVKSYQIVKSQLVNAQWTGLLYAHFDSQLLSLLDATIAISDSPEVIITTISHLLKNNAPKDADQLQNVISDREIDVLKLLATGLSNKEIADKLNISINTVITHRKNISQKTGIKSVSGLTIYAVLKNLVTLESFLK
jgi:DNA-binding NarL/FixJ family response regulator